MGKYDKFIHLLAVFIFCAFTQCGIEDITTSLNADHANRLLSSGKTKTWHLTHRSENGKDVFESCIEENTLVFVIASPLDSLYMMGRSVNCSPSSVVDTLYKAKYSVRASRQEIFQNQITMSEEKFQTIETISIHNLTSRSMSVSYTVDKIMIEEQYVK